MPRRSTEIRRNGGYVIVGHVWMRTEQGEWDRSLLRKLKKSGMHEWSKLAFVDGTSREMCLRCVSQSVTERHDARGTYLSCMDCGLDFSILPDTPDGPEQKCLPRRPSPNSTAPKPPAPPPYSDGAGSRYYDDTEDDDEDDDYEDYEDDDDDDDDLNGRG